MSKFSMADLLNSQSKAEGPKPEQKSEIVNIPIEKIIPSEKNKYGIRDIEELAATIETVGLLHNLVVKEGAEPDTYELVSGERRLEALKLLVQQGKAEYAFAPCKIETTDNQAISELQLLFANATARNLTDYEKTYQAKRIKELLLQLRESGYKFKGRMREIVAGLLKVSPAQMGRMESISKNLSYDFKEKFKDGEINATAAYELSRLPEQQQAQEMQKFKESGSVEIQDVKEHRKRGRPRKSGTEQREQSASDESKQGQRPDQEPKPGVEIAGQLRAVAANIEKEFSVPPSSISKICRKAADYIEQEERRKR